VAVLYPDQIGEAWAPEGERCFYCGEIRYSADTAIVWAGEVVIGLHVKCAERLAVAPLGDVREAQLSGVDGEPHWTRRCARALREGLTAQEMRS